MTGTGSANRRTVDAVQLSSDIIDVLRELDGAGVTEIATYLDRSKGTIHRHLVTLEANELVVKNDDTYRLSLRFLDFGEYVREQLDVSGIIREEVNSLADRTDEVAQAMTEEHGYGVYIHKATGENAVRTAASVGDRKYLHCTALGKAILAFTSTERVQEIIDKHGLPAMTDHTITDPETLFDHLTEIQERGVAFDDEEIQPGLRCVAAPILNDNSSVLGAISVSGPTSRMSDDRFTTDLPDLTTSAANVIEINVSNI